MAAKKKRTPHVENDSWVVFAAGRLGSEMNTTELTKLAYFLSKS